MTMYVSKRIMKARGERSNRKFDDSSSDEFRTRCSHEFGEVDVKAWKEAKRGEGDVRMRAANTIP